MGHFVSSPKEKEKRYRRDGSGYERKEQGRKRNRNESEETDSILYKSKTGRYRPVSYPEGPITARNRFIKNAYWVVTYFLFFLTACMTPSEKGSSP